MWPYGLCDLLIDKVFFFWQNSGLKDKSSAAHSFHQSDSSVPGNWMVRMRLWYMLVQIVSTLESGRMIKQTQTWPQWSVCQQTLTYTLDWETHFISPVCSIILVCYWIINSCIRYLQCSCWVSKYTFCAKYTAAFLFIIDVWSLDSCCCYYFWYDPVISSLFLLINP